MGAGVVDINRWRAWGCERGDEGPCKLKLQGNDMDVTRVNHVEKESMHRESLASPSSES